MSTGFCKLCSSDLSKEINRRLARGESRAQVRDWLAAKDFKVSLPTLTSHRQHITDPKTTLVDDARRNPAIKRVTSTDFLQAVVDMAAANIENSPQDVPLGAGIKAAALLEARREKPINVLMLIAQRATNRLEIPAEDIPLLEGEYEEIHEPEVARQGS